MFRASHAGIACTLFFVLTVHASAQQSAEARAIIDKAIEAAGGREALARYERPFYVEQRGQFFIPNRDTPTAEEVFKITRWLPDKERLERQTTSFGKANTSVLAFNGKEVKSATVKSGPATPKQAAAAPARPASPTAPAPKPPDTAGAQIAGKPDPAALADSIRLRLYVASVRTLLPLINEDYELATTTKAEVSGRPAVGVEVKHKDRPTIKLYFDTETTALVKLAREADGMEMVETYDDFAEMDGLVYPKRTTEWMRGRKARELETVEFKFFDEVPERAFDEI
jgi:hypothetical protein